METYGSISLRESFGKALAKAGAIYDDLRVFDAGTKNSTYSELFEKVFPDRFYTPGINEPGMIALATGLAMTGKRVVACDMSIFLTHAHAQIITAARQGDLHLILATSHTGITVGPDGGSAHDLTDLARMRTIPKFTVVAPWDGKQTEVALNEMLEVRGFYYMRLNRPNIPIFTTDETPFEFGKAQVLREGSKITIVAIGDKVYPALQIAESLGEGVAEVIGVHTIEPFDGEVVVKSAKKTGKVITIEDHFSIGGLYEAVAGILAEKHPTLMQKVCIERTFTTSGDPDELLKLYKLDNESILAKVKSFIG